MKIVYKPTNNWSNWYSPIIAGDSGNALGTIINNEFVALGTWYESNLTNYSLCPAISTYINDINTVINELGSNNTLTTTFLTAFTKY